MAVAVSDAHRVAWLTAGCGSLVSSERSLIYRDSYSVERPRHTRSMRDCGDAEKGGRGPVPGQFLKAFGRRGRRAAATLLRRGKRNTRTHPNAA